MKYLLFILITIFKVFTGKNIRARFSKNFIYCIEDYYPDNGNCIKAENPIPGCEIMYDKTKCFICIKYKMIKDGKCVEPENKINDCTRYLYVNEVEECLMCDNDKYPVYNKCENSPDNNCDERQKNKCFLCKTGFIFIDSGYECIKSDIKNCQILDDNKKDCRFCKLGYELTDNYECIEDENTKKKNSSKKSSNFFIILIVIGVVVVCGIVGVVFVISKKKKTLNTQKLIV